MSGFLGKLLLFEWRSGGLGRIPTSCVANGHEFKGIWSLGDRPISMLKHRMYGGGMLCISSAVHRDWDGNSV